MAVEVQNKTCRSRVPKEAVLFEQRVPCAARNHMILSVACFPSHCWLLRPAN